MREQFTHACYGKKGTRTAYLVCRRFGRESTSACCWAKLLFLASFLLSAFSSFGLSVSVSPVNSLFLSFCSVCLLSAFLSFRILLPVCVFSFCYRCVVPPLSGLPSLAFIKPENAWSCATCMLALVWGKVGG